MTNTEENIDNEYILKAVITIKENGKRITDYIKKNFATGLEEELIESILMELPDHNITEN